MLMTATIITDYCTNHDITLIGGTVYITLCLYEFLLTYQQICNTFRLLDVVLFGRLFRDSHLHYIFLVYFIKTKID